MQVTPSTFQVNEGDSLSTSLSGFTPNSTLYFKVSGRGVSKKDFAAGGVKGRVQVDSNGVGTISHTLRADKATEGNESFAIQVFSDKKMKMLVGQSDAVTIFDTSAKAGKTPKSGSGNTNNSNLSYTDLITGATIRTDTLYEGVDLLSRAIGDPQKKLASEVELSQNQVIVTYTFETTLYDNTLRTNIERTIFSGAYTYNNGKITGDTERITRFTAELDNGVLWTEYGGSMELLPKTTIDLLPARNATQLASGVKSALYVFRSYSSGRAVPREEFEKYSSGTIAPSTLLLSDRNQLGNLPDANLVPNEWWLDPFAPNLI